MLAVSSILSSACVLNVLFTYRTVSEILPLALEGVNNIESLRDTCDAVVNIFIVVVGENGLYPGRQIAVRLHPGCITAQLLYSLDHMCY